MNIGVNPDFYKTKFHENIGFTSYSDKQLSGLAFLKALIDGERKTVSTAIAQYIKL